MQTSSGKVDSEKGLCVPKVEVVRWYDEEQRVSEITKKLCPLYTFFRGWSRQYTKSKMTHYSDILKHDYARHVDRRDTC